MLTYHKKPFIPLFKQNQHGTGQIRLFNSREWSQRSKIKYSWPLKNEGVQPPAVENPCITSQLDLCIQCSLSADSTNHGSCSTVIFIEKNTHKVDPQSSNTYCSRVNCIPTEAWVPSPKMASANYPELCLRLHLLEEVWLKQSASTPTLTQILTLKPCHPRVGKSNKPKNGNRSKRTFAIVPTKGGV